MSYERHSHYFNDLDRVRPEYLLNYTACHCPTGHSSYFTILCIGTL